MFRKSCQRKHKLPKPFSIQLTHQRCKTNPEELVTVMTAELTTVKNNLSIQRFKSRKLNWRNELLSVYFLYILCMHFLFPKIVSIAQKGHCVSCLTYLICCIWKLYNYKLMVMHQKHKPTELPCYTLKRRITTKGKSCGSVGRFFAHHNSLSDLLELLTIIRCQMNIKRSDQYNETAGHLQCSEHSFHHHPVESV